MNRRNFLKFTGLGAAAMSIPSAGLAAVSLKDALAGIIYNEFDYLKLDKAGVEQFAEDYLAEYPNNPFYVKTRIYYAMGLTSRNSKLVSHYASQYLQSTDFFMNKMDETKPVNYLGFFNPYKRPCANPFCFLFYPSDQPG